MGWSTADSFKPERVARVPSGKKGIYVIWGEKSNQPLYYGMSTDCIKGRLEKHVNGQGNFGIKEALRTGSEGMMFFSWKETNDPAFEEAALIRTGLPQFNIKQERNPLKID